MHAKKLYDHRIFIVLIAFSIWLGCMLYAWIFIPYPAFTLNWRPDRQMQVAEITPDSIAAKYLQVGDKIIAIDGRRVHRTAIFHPPQPRKSTYRLTIDRDGHILEHAVSYLPAPDNYAYSTRGTMGAVTLAIWLIGAATLYYARRNQIQAIHFGLICLFTATVFISWTTSLMGVPIVWIMGQPLAYLVAVSWIYLGQLPHYTPFSRRSCHIFFVIATVAALLGVLSLIEGFLFFPRATSIQELTGISLYQISAIAQMLGGFSIFGGLAIRRLRAKSDYLREQLNILIFFDLLGAFPDIFLTFLPLALWGKPILPIPLAAVGSTAVLLGIFYVLFRDTRHEFDVGFGRFSQYVVLFFVFLLLYGFLLRGITDWWGTSVGTVEISLLLFALTLIIAPKLSNWINHWMHTIIFGNEAQLRHTVLDLTAQLHRSPTPQMLSDVTYAFVELLNIAQSVVALSKIGELVLAVQTGSVTLHEDVTTIHLPTRTIHRQQLSTSEMPPIFTKHPWADVAIPLQLHNQELIGVWLLAKPVNAFFTHRSLQLAEQVASALAVGIDMIELLDSAEQLTKRITIEERGKQDFAALLHDQPIQKLTAIRAMMGDITRLANRQESPLATYLNDIGNDLNELEKGLRGIYEGTYQSAILEGLTSTVHYLITSFQADHDIVITLSMDAVTEIEQQIRDVLTRTVYFTLQEALNNVAKHSGATTVEIMLENTETHLQLTINDNGCFQSKSLQAATDLQREKHFGIAGMLRRVTRNGGTLTISPNKKGGTKLYITLPL